MDRPDRIAFIAGAPRCGTTTISRLFRRHPEVCFSFVKEPHFFARVDLRGLDEEALREIVECEYLERFFSHCPAGRSMAMEGSPTYFYVPEQIAPVLKLWPDAKFIITLRDPMAMVPSLHSRMLVTGDETIKDFRKAWEMSASRREGRSVPPRCADPRFLLYDQAAAFGSYLTRFFDCLGRDRCHVVLLDDLDLDPARTYRELCDFLEIEPRPKKKFKAARTNLSYRSGWLQRLLKRPPKAAPGLLAGRKYLAREGRRVETSESRTVAAILALRKRVLKWNQIPAERQPLEPAARQMIADRYRHEIDILSRLIDRDLSHWLKVG